MNRLLAVILVVLVALATGVGAWWYVQRPTAEDGPSGENRNSEGQAVAEFRDVTPESGLHFTYHNGEEAEHYAILESLGGGVALIDYDGDGLLDLFLTGGGRFDRTDAEYRKEPQRPPAILGRPCKLFRNLGGFKFADVTAETGLDHPWHYTHGAAVADYDRDGWPDLFVTGYGRVALFRNVPADPKAPERGRKFAEVTEAAGLLGPHVWASGAAWGDLDGDGWPDLYVCQYVDWSWETHIACEGYSAAVPRDVCPPRQFDARPHLLYRNEAGRRFTQVGAAAGLRAPRRPEDYDRLTHLDAEAKERLREGDHERDYGKGLGVLIVDLDGNGRPEVCVANDTTDKFLYLNVSEPGRIRLTESGRAVGTAWDDRGLPNGSMGLDAGDYEESGRPSLLVTNYENELHGLYRNAGSGQSLLFEYASLRAGLGSLGRGYVGFGTGFLDLDNDGRLDIVIANGHVIRHPARAPVRQRPVLLRNLGSESGAKKRFVNVSDTGGAYFRAVHQGRGLAVGDLDNDGRPDLVISHINEPAVVLRNETGANRHWLGIELVGKSHADVVGARVTLQVGDRTQTRFAKGGGSYLSSGDRRLLFGLGTADRVGRLTVVWPDGSRQQRDGLTVDRYWRITQGAAE